MKIGVLALQGDVPEQRRAFERLLGPGAVVHVLDPAGLSEVDALVIPGGESTTIAQLIDQAGLRTPLLRRIEGGLPVLATCAGLILLSARIEPVPGLREPVPLRVLEITVRRNDYGRQRESFEAPVGVEGLEEAPFPGVFIRAPRILSRGPKAHAIANRGDEIVGVSSGRVWGFTFHPELSDDPRLHELFLSETLGWKRQSQKTSRTATKSPTATATKR
ncbi:MAG TPA: pyridoxal 5'-phosphate synthase glutaminase subunit PdxT [Thermoplasmata archaeon]|nr:pyridoxal 5'-phosphate synthase glutaminase subunit PdxT [Thermoplasmata archaeon]HUI38634.1 pyridoxal 5'-phosphate synthase glutaminase subunit PdxT [Thermoplasmata archaeon]